MPVKLKSSGTESSLQLRYILLRNIILRVAFVTARDLSRLKTVLRLKILAKARR